MQKLHRSTQEGQPAKQKAGSLLRGSGLGGTAWHGPLGGPSKAPLITAVLTTKVFTTVSQYHSPETCLGQSEKGSISDRMTHIVQIQGPDG